MHDAAKVSKRVIVLKNSKIRLPHFSANFHCISKVDATCPEQAMTAAHIARPVFWPIPWPKIFTASQRATFSPTFGKTGVFQHNRWKPVIRCGRELQVSKLEELIRENRRLWTDTLSLSARNWSSPRVVDVGCANANSLPPSCIPSQFGESTGIKGRRRWACNDA